MTDANNCTVSTCVTVTAPSAATTSVASQTNVSCTGASTGSATVSVVGGTGPFAFVWSAGAGGQTTATATGLNAATHIVSVTDANNCLTIQNVIITQPANAVSVTASIATLPSGTQISCNGVSDATATAVGAGGVTPYQFLWSAAAQTTTTATGLGAGQHCVTITDANGCSSTETVNMILSSTDEINFVESFNDPRLRVCIDTCHVFACRNKKDATGKGYDPIDYIQEGLKKPGLIKLIHFNDSLEACGSCKDRHAFLGTGRMGFEKMRDIAHLCSAHNLPMVIE
jgi:hypothetical protein